MPLWRIGLYVGLGLLVIVLAIVSPGFRRFLFFMLLFGRGGRGGGGGGSGSRRRRQLRRRRVEQQLLTAPGSTWGGALAHSGDFPHA